MSKEVEVIFVQDRKGQFRVGQQKRVKLGYARNYLIPQNLAEYVTAENRNLIEKLKKQAEKQLAEAKKVAEEAQGQLKDAVVTFKVKTHDKGKLYGSITPDDVVSELNKLYEVSLDKFDLKMASAIKEVGDYRIAVTLHSDVPISVRVLIESEEAEQEEAAAKKSKKAAEEPEDAESNEVAEETVAESGTEEAESDSE